MSTEAFLRHALQQIDSEITAEHTSAARSARHAPIPAELHPAVRAYFAGDTLFQNGLYSHQSEAIARGLAGEHICVCTPTASGKTVIFTSVVVSALKTNPGKKALALYPAKALIHDQVAKWQAISQDRAIKTCYIHGGVRIAERSDMLKESDVILMTPDVLHAWIMSNLNQPEIQAFLQALDIVVLDEAHIYDGVLGTNMVYLLRRLQAVSAVRQFMLSTATIGNPDHFAHTLTGQTCRLIEAGQDGSYTPPKKIMVARMGFRHLEARLKRLIQALATSLPTPFLVFADSRMRVETLASQVNPGVQESATASGNPLILPYRAGYEDADRESIQKALTRGHLAGVVSTSALELGIDIPQIELVINLGIPCDARSFWQRAGRAGRGAREGDGKQGIMLLIEFDKPLDTFGGLEAYLSRPVDSACLYLENEYLQYANVLCAAEEQINCPAAAYKAAVLTSLPERFGQFLENEINPTRSIEPELYRLKQEANGGSHRAFPLRSGMEKTYSVQETGSGNRLGTLSYAQLLREAYPGAIYRYMGRSFRVVNINHAEADVRVIRARSSTTQPLRQIRVFPQGTAALCKRQVAENLIMETRLQVSERVIGFTEKTGNQRAENRYGIGSSWSQRPLGRYIETTGVCFCFEALTAASLETLSGYVMEAFATVCGIHLRDIGHGSYFRAASWDNPRESRGFAVYDAVCGSLRLTHRLLENLDAVFEEALRQAVKAGATRVQELLYTPQGLRYELQHANPAVRWIVTATSLRPIHSLTRMLQYNLMTGDEQDSGYPLAA